MCAFSPAAGNGSARQILPGHPGGPGRGAPHSAGRCPGAPRPAALSRRPRPPAATRHGHGRDRTRRPRWILRPLSAEQLRSGLPGRARQPPRGADGGPGELLHPEPQPVSARAAPELCPPLWRRLGLVPCSSVALVEITIVLCSPKDIDTGWKGKKEPFKRRER